VVVVCSIKLRVFVLLFQHVVLFGKLILIIACSWNIIIFESSFEKGKEKNSNDQTG